MKRWEVPEELTWDLTSLYPDDEACFKDLDFLESVSLKAPDVLSRESMAEFLEEYEHILKVADRAANYGELRISSDFSDMGANLLVQRLQVVMAKVLGVLALAMEPVYEMKDFSLWENSKYRAFFRKIKRESAHRLTPSLEKFLADFTPVTDLPYEVYQGAKFMDLKFPPFTIKGKEYPLSFSLFEDYYEYEKDTEVRRGAFAAFSEELRKYQNTMATAFLGMVKRDVILAKARGYDDVFHYLLAGQEIPKEVHHRHLDLIMEHLPGMMRRYAAWLKESYGLSSMRYEDLKLPPKLSRERKVTIPRAEEWILSSLEPMGEDYVSYIRRAFHERWVDFAQNEGKSTGGFCSSAYGIHSYILMNWHGLLSDVFTLAHELGHSGHFHLTDTQVGITEREPSLYFVEAPSTTGELLLTDYLYRHAETEEDKRDIWALSLANTYYHNFVTHFLEGYFQREVYERAQRGELLLPETLNEIMKETLEKFWGDTVELTPGAELTWMRQPHYYTGLYSYTYSAGLSLGTVVSRAVTEDPSYGKVWRRVLEGGGRRTPGEILKELGLDLEKGDFVLETVEKIGTMVDRITCKDRKEEL